MQTTVKFLTKLNDVARLETQCSSSSKEEKFDCFMEKLTEDLPIFEEFLTQTNLKETEQTDFSGLKQLYTAFADFTGNRKGGSKFGEQKPEYQLASSHVKKDLIDCSHLRNLYEQTFRPLVARLQRDIDFREYEEFSNNHGSYKMFFEIKGACDLIEVQPRNLPTLSVKDVCPTRYNCAPSIFNSSDNACGQNNECDINKAIPLMIGVFFYKVSFAVFNRFCRENCTDGGCKLTREDFSSIIKQVELMKAFRSLPPDDPFATNKFFQTAISKQAYYEIAAAMEIIGKNEQHFKKIKLDIASFACKENISQPACHVARVYPHYLLLKKMKEKRLDPGHTGDTRDLTLYQNVDHAKIIELKKETVKHNELLSAVNQLNENLETQVRGIASYFKGVASFDEDVADADVIFIKGKLKDFDGEYKRLKREVNSDMEDIKRLTRGLVITELVENTVALVAKMAEESNPIAAIFTGVDSSGIRDAAKDVAKAAANVRKAEALASAMEGLANDTEEIGTCLHNNQNQINSMKSLVDKIKNNQADDIGDDAETFITEYSNYTPKVAGHRMAQNIAKWGAFKDSFCDLINGAEGVGASGAKAAIANGILFCENLEASIAEFGALRENIFDFQFEMVDSLARVMRGNVAKKLADSIQGQEDDIFKADQLLGGFLMSQQFMQSHAWLYCDKLEYKNEGQRVQACSPRTGLFTNHDLDNLVAFKTEYQTQMSVVRTVHIPTKPQYEGDLGFINIQRFTREKKASFRLPRNVTWLYKFDWSLIGESQAPYVENFQLFLPNREYNTGSGKKKRSTRIVVTADTQAGSYVSANVNSSVLYKLPEMQTSYVTVYQEGYRSSTCPQEIRNPYSLCNNLPNICLTSSNEAGDSLLPTTLSKWKVTYNVQSGEEVVKWLAPTNVTTNLNLIAKIKLRMPKVSANPLAEITRANDQPDLCCEGDTYRASLVDSVCTDCPTGSTSKLGGYYCEASYSTEGKKKRKKDQGKMERKKKNDRKTKKRKNRERVASR